MMKALVCWLLVVAPTFAFSQSTPGGVADDGALLLWLSAADMQRYAFFSNEEVTTWPDLSPNGSHASTNITSNWPDLIESYLNGQPALSFETTGVDEHLDGTLALEPDASLTLVTVGRFAPALTSAATQLGVGGNSGGASREATISRQNSPAMNYYSFTGSTRSTGPVVNDQNHIWMAAHTITAPFHSLYLDNLIQTISVDYVSPLNAINTNFSLGRNSAGAGASYLDGELSEVIVINRLINTVERNILANYLSAKYALAITTDLYSYDSPSMGDYDHELGGIGMENGNFWSRGNSGGLGFAPSGGLENGDYVLAAHRSRQNSVNTFDIVEAGGSLTARWSRAWAIDVTDQGTPLSIDMTFDFSQAGLGSTPGAHTQYRLIREISAGTWEVVASASGVVNFDQVQFSSIAITDGIYTIATSDLVAGPLENVSATFGSGPAGFGRTDGSDALELWLDASQLGLTSGATVGTWPDLSGNGHDATQLTVFNQPVFQTNQFNSLPAVVFSQADPDYMNGTLGNLDAPATIVAVGYFNQLNQTGADAEYIFGVGEPPLASTTPGVRASISRRWPDSGPARADRYYSYDGEYEYYGPVLTGQSLHIMSSIFQTSFPYHQVAIDGVFSRTVTGPVPLNTNGDYDLGRLVTQNQFNLDGSIAELIVYRTALNTTQMRILQSALAAKWGVAIQNDLYTGDDPANGNLDTGITGIGRTIDGDVGTAQSGGLTVSLGSAAANGSFLLLGNSGISSARQSTDISSTSVLITSRLTTTWFASLTGSLGNTTSYTLDFGDMGIAGEPTEAANRYGILYRGSTSGNWTVLASATSAIGDRLTFSNITLPGSGFVTFALLDQPLPIELTHFDARVVEEDGQPLVALQWETASERNNDFFTVERSADAQSWQPVAQVKGAGTSTSAKPYSAFDQHPPHGISYYRLLQTDFDGNRAGVGSLVRVEIKDRLIRWKLVPQPASSHVAIVFDTAPDEEIAFEILDIMGKQVARGMLGDKETIVTLDLADGMYVVRIANADQLQTQRMLVRKGTH